MFIDTIPEGISDFPMMLRTITTIKIINVIKIVWFKGIRKFIGNDKIPIVTDFIAVIIIQFAIQIGWTIIIVIISVTYRKIKPRGKFIVNIQIDGAAGTNAFVVYCRLAGWLIYL